MSGALLRPSGRSPASLAARLPPHVFFLASAVFHYLGPAFAVLLFARIAPLGVAWLRIASAAAVFAVFSPPWRVARALPREELLLVVGLGGVLAAMNGVFYEAIARLPLGTVGAIEFLGPVALAAAGARTRRNAVALVLAAGGVAVLSDVRIRGEPLGYAFAFANCVLFVLYVMLGHRIAAGGGGRGIARLGLAMLAASLAMTPAGIRPALVAFAQPLLLAAGIGVGICSSVIPYVCDQLAMARLPRASFALLLSLLPAMAEVIGFVVLGQVPRVADLAGIALVVAGVAMHRPIG